MNRKDGLYKRLREIEKAMENCFITNDEYMVLREERSHIIGELLSEEMRNNEM